MIGIAAADLDMWLTAFFYPFFRMLALMSSAPVFSHASVPIPVRILLALMLTILVAPMLPAIDPVSPLSAPGALLIFQQVLVGVALGFAMQLAFAAVEMAGDMIGLQMGLSFAVFIDPQNSDQTPIVGSFLSMILMLVFLTINGHLMMVSALVSSFQAVPIAIGASAGGTSGATWFRLAEAGRQIFESGLQIAFPLSARSWSPISPSSAHAYGASAQSVRRGLSDHRDSGSADAAARDALSDSILEATLLNSLKLFTG
jgi:flagellar biosynthetic protein FliR